MKPLELQVFTSFSGYDSQCLALDLLCQNFPDFSYNLVGWSDIDKYAIQAHNALYPQWADRNYGDITTIDWEQVPDFDLFIYTFPCQSISNAGKQRGLTEGSGTRSSLLWECRRAIKQKKPKFLLMENVKALAQKKFMPEFQRWIDELADMGYANFWQVLNSKDYGVPQNRERVFMISILDCNQIYRFPEPFPLEYRLKDVLESDVDESYYLKQDQVDKIIARCDDKLAELLRNPNSDEYRQPKICKMGNIYPNGLNAGAVYHPDGIAPTVMENHGEVIRILEQTDSYNVDTQLSTPTNPNH